ncbi:SNF2-related protein [Myxococcus sp. AB036A]|uniref:SNF2-related protein n=1 Tax=Myxococcus sp. AB036A TaxID=2562793 RepID=UPI0034CEC14F
MKASGLKVQRPLSFQAPCVPAPGGGAQHAGPRVALTGTPMENRLSELWSLYALLFPGCWAAARPLVRAWTEAHPDLGRSKAHRSSSSRQTAAPW